LTHIDVPTRDDLRDIEPSSRLYADENAIYLTASILCRADSPTPVLTDIAFVLTPNCLVTVRYDDPKSFKLFAAALCKLSGGATSARLTLARLMETIADRTAEILEQAEVRGDALLVRIFGENGEERGRRMPKELENLLVEISAHHRLISKARGSLTTLSRVMTFLQAVEVVRQDREVKELVKSIARDIQSLSEHANFLSGNITFLLDASLGLINVEQNAIIKIFLDRVGGVPASDFGCVHLRYELQVYARARMGIRLPVVADPDGDLGDHSVPILSMERLAVSQAA
jgi:magnesium transporter